MLLTACASEPEPPIQSTEPVAEKVAVFTTPIKVKATVEDTAGNPYLFEVQVDENGNGSGKAKVLDTVVDVNLFGGNVYLSLPDLGDVEVEGLNAWMIHDDVDVMNLYDPLLSGFTTNASGALNGYSRMAGGLSVVSKFVSTEADGIEYSLPMPSGSETYTLAEVVELLTPNEPISFGAEESTYLNLASGVKLNDVGVRVSIGDSMQVSTYMDGMVPSGILTSQETVGGKVVSYLHTYWSLPTGDTIVTTVDGKVVSVWSDADFTLLGIQKGVTDRELKSVIPTYTQRAGSFLFNSGGCGVELTLEKSKVVGVYVYDSD